MCSCRGRDKRERVLLMGREIKSEPALLQEVRKYGQFDVGGCYNCGSCTISCPLSGNLTTFPRRVMRYVLFGLKDLLNSSLEPWMCYYCGDCSTACPQQAEPGEAMMTLRRYLTAQYDWTGLASRLYSSAAWRIGANFFTGLFVFLIVFFYHLYDVKLSGSDFFPRSMPLEHMFPTMIYFTLAVFVIPIALLLTNAARMHSFIIGRENIKVPLSLYLKQLGTFVVHAFTQKRFRECKDKGRWIKHMIMVSGFIVPSLLVLFFLRWFQTDNIYPVYNPQRWLGYLATIALLYGSIETVIGRIRKKGQMHRFSSPDDWVLPAFLFLTAVSGITIHICRYAGLAMVAHYAYFAHIIIVVPMLVIEIPFGKLSHIFYRPLAIYLHSVKQRAAIEQNNLTEAKVA